MPKPYVPIRERPGVIVVQHLIDIPIFTDDGMTPGTIEVWQDGVCIGRIENIGSR